MSQSLTFVAAGRAADAYRRADGCLVQLFHAGVPRTLADAEMAAVQAARAAGVATPVLREVIEHEDRFGIVSEPLEGQLMVITLLQYPDRAKELGRQLAELHADLHTRLGPTWRSLHEAVRSKLTGSNLLAEPLRDAALAALDKLTPGLALCHGNFHPDNIVLTPGGPVIVAWCDASAGPPAADVARTTLLLRFRGPEEDADPRVVELVRRVRPPFQNAYWQRYAELRPADAEQVQAWTLPLAAALLADPLTERERQMVLALVERLVRWSQG